MKMVAMNVDLSLEENKNPVATPDDGEHIQCKIIQLDNLLNELHGIFSTQLT
jgi:hypothetical protein